MANQTHGAHGAHHAHAPNVDKPAAYVGLISAVIFLLVVVLTIVSLTNKKYAGHRAEGAAAEATH
jgi:hypothetical protein